MSPYSKAYDTVIIIHYVIKLMSQSNNIFNQIYFYFKK